MSKNTKTKSSEFSKTAKALETMVVKDGTLWRHPRLFSSKVGRPREVLQKRTFRYEVCGPENKTGTSKVGAISKAQKAQSFGPRRFSENIRKHFRKFYFEKKIGFSCGKCPKEPKTIRSSLCSQNVSFLVKVEGVSMKTN